MQPNPFLTVLKIAAFAVLAFLVGVSSCQKANLEDKVSRLDSSVAGLARAVEDLERTIRRGGLPSTGTTGPAVKGPEERRRELDASASPSKPLGTPGRYKDFLGTDPDDPEYPPQAAKWDQGEIGRWFGSEPKGFNFIIENSADITNYIEQYVADSPASRQWKNPSLWKPAVCWRVEVSPDYREYTLFLRDDVLWHEPAVDLSKYPHLQGRHPVTANDVKFTLDIIRNPQTDCAALRGYYTDVEDVKVVDDHTVVVRWSKTVYHSIAFTLGLVLTPEFLYAYGEDGRRFPDVTIGQSFNEHFYNRVGCIGCGPYRFVSYEPGQRIILERFEDWYGVHDGVRYPIRRHRYLIYPDAVTNLLKIQAGEVELSGLNAPQWRSQVLENTDPNSPFVNGQIRHFILKSANYAYFGWRNTHPLFKDKTVRKALSYACNRDEICQKIFLGRFRPMSSPVYPDSPEADPDIQPMPFDLTEAARLLDEAGWKVNASSGLREKVVDGATKSFEFTLYWPGPSPDFEAALNQYKNDLLRVGVKMNTQSMEWAVYQKKLHDREFDACSLLWATNGWEHDFDQIWHSRGIKDPGSSNYIEFSNPEVDRLSDELRTTMDPQERIQKVRRIGRILYEEQPYCFFAWQNSFTVHRSYVKNVEGHLYKMRPVLRTFPMWIER